MALASPHSSLREALAQMAVLERTGPRYNDFQSNPALEVSHKSQSSEEAALRWLSGRAKNRHSRCCRAPNKMALVTPSWTRRQAPLQKGVVPPPPRLLTSNATSQKWGCFADSTELLCATSLREMDFHEICANRFCFTSSQATSETKR